MNFMISLNTAVTVSPLIRTSAACDCFAIDAAGNAVEVRTIRSPCPASKRAWYSSGVTKLRMPFNLEPTEALRFVKLH